MKTLLIQGLMVLSTVGLVAAQDPPTTPPAQTPPAGSQAGQSDSQVSTNVRQALMNDSTTQSVAQHVRVTTKNGMVTLKGKVDNATDHDAIMAKAKSIVGDSNVKDELTVSSK
jgi:hyperosmotically inducible protein